MKYLLCLAVIGINLQAATFTAASTSRSAVGTAYALCSDGDTLAIPAGTSQWTNTLEITKSITVQGAGVGQTILLDDVINAIIVGTGEAVFLFTTVSNKFYRLSGVEIRRGTSRTDQYLAGCVQFTGSTRSFRVDNCKFDQVRNRAISTFGSTCGVIDHCTFNMFGTQAINVTHHTWNDLPWGDASWAVPVDWGTTNAVYIEDNYFTNTNSFHNGLLDSFSGARWVFRYNTISNEYVEAHGTESGQRHRGTRSYEIYMNRFSDNLQSPAVHLRSGTGVIWSNTAAGNGDLCAVVNYRAIYQYPFWGGADGTNAWDVNVAGGPFTSGAASSGGTLSLTDSSKSWTANQWSGYSLQNLTQTRFSEINSNSTTTIYFRDAGGNAGGDMTFSAGNTYAVFKVDTALDQVGRSTGDLLSGDDPTPVGWPHQALEPLYEWNNTVDGHNGQIATIYATLRSGRDFLNDTPKPGYTPLVYPHPLVGSGGGGGSPTLVSIEVTPANPSVVGIGTKQFTATGTYSDASTADITTSSVWTSGDTGVATVNSATGLATGVASGMASITATKSAIAGSTTLTVTAPVLASITINPASASIAVGATKRFAATGVYSDGSTQNITSSSAWASGNPAIATIGASSGLATGVAVGTISITAIKSDIVGAATLSVATTSIGGKTKLHGRVHLH